jgi:hypothetical protein
MSEKAGSTMMDKKKIHRWKIILWVKQQGTRSKDG